MSNFAVPPVERIAIPNSDKPLQKSTIPDLSDTLTNARLTTVIQFVLLYRVAFKYDIIV